MNLKYGVWRYSKHRGSVSGSTNMGTAYTEDQYDLSYGDGTENYWWHLTRNRIVAEEVGRFSDVNPKVLDVGCGRGIAVKYLRDRGIECNGVEIGTTHALEPVGEHVRYGIDAIELPMHERMAYDVVLLLDVIEHLPDPGAFVRSLIGAFPNVSRIIATVPACPELWSNYDETFGHHRRYTAAMLCELAGELRLEILHQSFFFHALYLPARILAALKRRRATRVRPPLGWRRILQGGIAWAMWLDYKILPAWLPGMSAITTWRVR